MTDPIADMLTRIRNGYRAGKRDVSMPASKIKRTIAEKLVSLSYLESFKVEDNQLILTLAYVGKTPSITQLKRISTPGRRVYVSAKNLPRILSGYGSSIISTSKGVMTDKEARQTQLGGEILCQVW